MDDKTEWSGIGRGVDDEPGWSGIGRGVDDEPGEELEVEWMTRRDGVE